eukprot:scaffold21851_cov50-Skeletonema_dohrnii-CCMP3373.AAC.1
MLRIVSIDSIATFDFDFIRQITDRMGVATRLPPKYDRGGLLRGSRVCSSERSHDLSQRPISTFGHIY